VCKYLPSNGHANGEQMLKLKHTYMNERVIRWKRRVNICTDGAVSMKEKERVMLLQILGKNHLDALFHVFIYFMSLHVSSVTTLIIRRSNCINTSSGMISLCDCLVLY
jgi:hypothetical protein